MDDHHGILMDTINELRLALVRGCGREKACALLDQLIEFMRMHFYSEEQLMEQTGFAELGKHRAEHHRMLAGILQAAHRLQYGEAFELSPLLCELHDGFLQHIDGMDQAYGPWLNRRGVN
jgi:hemerythrin-like metal-binding protein